jgi:hypothetical protein
VRHENPALRHEAAPIVSRSNVALSALLLQPDEAKQRSLAVVGATVKSAREILARIEKLVAQASSPEQEEARTAAQLAVEMMWQYGVKLSLGDDHVIACAAPAAKTEEPCPQPSTRPKKRAPTSIQRTVLIYRCSGCARVVLKPGLCVGCIKARSEIGIWNVTCEGCGQQAPGASAVEKAHDLAKALGYEVTDDERTLCPECLSKEIPWQRAVR